MSVQSWVFTIFSAKTKKGSLSVHSPSTAHRTTFPSNSLCIQILLDLRPRLHPPLDTPFYLFLVVVVVVPQRTDRKVVAVLFGACKPHLDVHFGPTHPLPSGLVPASRAARSLRSPHSIIVVVQ